ncbi:MAG: hypothetical protein Tsb0033_21180 [Winogradskyella sp.]
MNILIIEDDKKKVRGLMEYFRKDDVKVCESFQSGMRELKNNSEKYDFLILDMTIPLWEKGRNDIGGNYEQFGGEKILREMKRRNLMTATILFTMFDVFPTKTGTITFSELNQNYLEHFSGFYRGAVFYNTNEDNWIEALNKLIKKQSDE